MQTRIQREAGRYETEAILWHTRRRFNAEEWARLRGEPLEGTWHPSATRRQTRLARGGYARRPRGSSTLRSPPDHGLGRRGAARAGVWEDRLTRFRAELVALQQAGASYRELARWLCREQRQRVDPTAIRRFLIQLPELQAHCHLGLGTLYARTGQREQAHAELSAAIDLYLPWR